MKVTTNVNNGINVMVDSVVDDRAERAEGIDFLTGIRMRARLTDRNGPVRRQGRHREG